VVPKLLSLHPVCGVCGLADSHAIGMAAATSVIQCMSPGSTIILPDNLYFNVVQAMDLIYRPLGIQYVQVWMSVCL
jgi:cystathionine beta-lyase/cystathionine gamma-synthase